jgi:hypothetical protein
MEKLEEFRFNLQSEAFSRGSRGIEGTVTVSGPGYISGRGVNVNRLYRINGHEFEERDILYDDEGELKSDVVTDCQDALYEIVKYHFDVDHIGSNGNVHKFRIKPSFETMRAYREFRKESGAPGRKHINLQELGSQ